LISQLFKLEKERDKAAQDAQKHSNTVTQLIEECRIKGNLIIELKKTNSENETKLKQQQSLYETVRSERNLYSKSLIEQTDEVQELKKRFVIAEQ